MFPYAKGLKSPGHLTTAWIKSFIMTILLFYVTYPDEAAARLGARAMVEKRLAACANIFPMQSAYWWEGAVCHAGEWVAMLKTRVDCAETLEKAIQESHPYAVPCILRIAAEANTAYAEWISKECA